MSIEKQATSFVEKPVRTLFKWVIILCLLGGVVTTFKFLTMPATKMVERHVLVNSHQYIEGMEQRANTLKANIATVDSMLAVGNGDTSNLLAQKRALQAQLAAISK